MQRSRTASLAFIALAGLASSAMAGPLNPPAGPVAGTYKTLTEVEPRVAINAANTPGDASSTYRIAQGGSYYLTSSLSGEAGKSCIVIAASNVTIDLMGFRIVGSGAALDGITTSGAQSNITVRNGSVRTFGGDGVDLGLAPDSRIIDITARNCDGVGVVAGETSVLTRVIVESNVSGGVHVLGRSVVESCSAFDNQVFGFQINSGSTVTGCSAGDNSGDGFLVEIGCTIARCTAYGNIRGIVTQNGCSVTACTVRNSGTDGIVVASSCVVRDNACSVNGVAAPGGAGILVLGADNRLEGNNCVSADRGIDVNSGGNIIMRNSCSSNGVNWSLAANNIFGTIVDRTGVAVGAVNGNAAASSLGTTDANANVTY